MAGSFIRSFLSASAFVYLSMELKQRTTGTSASFGVKAAHDEYATQENVGLEMPADADAAPQEDMSPGRNAIFLTYNGDGQLDVVANKLYDHASDADVIVICQQEAKHSLATAIPVWKDWTPIAYAEHWGATTDGMNAQILAVLLKTPGGNGSWPARKDMRVPSSVAPNLGMTGAISDYVYGDPSHGSTKIHNFHTGMGKGGASVTLPGLGLTVICAHLDASVKDDIRDDQVNQLLSESESTANVVILGDLNYRIHKPAPEVLSSLDDVETMASLLVGDRTDVAALYDPLNVHAKRWRSDSVLDADNRIKASWVGVGEMPIQCNTPWGEYMPTYKLGDVESCAKVNEGDVNATTVLQCFGQKSKPKSISGRLYGSGEVKYSLKKGLYLNVGWLDRVCWRGSLQLVKDFTFGPSGSDHMPVVVKMTIA